MGSPDLIDVRDLHHAYSDGRSVLNGISFCVAEGESIGLLGPNGAGKTTLFLCLCGVLRPTSGTMRIAGLDPCKPADRKKLPGTVGIVFQNSDDQLFCSTVEEDVAFGPFNLGLPADEVRSRVTESLAQVGMSGQEQRAPFQLSGGEKRRTAMAGIVAMRPAVLLLDEPSVFLDPKGRRELIQLIQQLPGTRLIASHDLGLVRRTCSRVLILDAGKIVADGPVSMLDDVNLLREHDLED